MLPQANRLRKQKDFDAVFQRGRAAGNEFFNLKFHPNQQVVSRFGLVVSGQVSKRAVRRNRLRRQIIEILRAVWPNIKPGLDIVIVVKPATLKINAPELKQSLLRLLTAKHLYA